MCYVSCPEKYIFNIRLADDDLFCIVLLVARHRIDRRHRNTQTAPKEWEYSRRLKTSQDVLRCIETSRLARSSLVKCTRQSMCHTAQTLIVDYPRLVPVFLAIVPHDSTPCIRSHCTLSVPVPLMPRTSAHAGPTGASVTDHVRALIPIRSEETAF